MKKLGLLFLLLTAANSFAMEEKLESRKFNCFNYVKNKTASGLKYISDTIKLDLGFANKLEDNPYPPYSLTKDLAAGCRLYCYHIATQTIINTLFSRLVSLKDLPSQFAEASPRARAIIVAPLFEETLMTYLISRILRLRYGQIITPLIFSSLHYHDDPKRWIFNATHIASLSYFNVRYYLTREEEEWSFAPLISHMINNAVAVYLTGK